MNLTPEELMREIVTVLDRKKALDITALKIKDLSTIGDYFVIASGSSNTQVKALTEEVEDHLSKMALWILMDYYDVVVHIFYKETREFYSIERLWSDAPRIDIDDLLTAD